MKYCAGIGHVNQRRIESFIPQKAPNLLELLQLFVDGRRVQDFGRRQMSGKAFQNQVR